jgi:C-terminal processing protease CtpA/Prc
MRAAFAILVVLFTSATHASEPTPPVKMAPFQVFAEQFEIDADLFYKGGVRYIHRMTVRSVTKDSEAERAGLRRGMNILSIYGVPVSGRVEHEFVQEYLSREAPDRATIVVSRFIGGPRTIEIFWRKKRSLP